MDARPTTVLVCALGGEGGGVLAEWLVETASACGHAAQSTSIPGVAQRTGATTYYIETFPQADAELGGRRPVFSLNPAPGAIDLLVSSELLETARQVALGMATRERTHVITADHRALTVAEKMQPADGRVDAEALRRVLMAHSTKALVLDLATIAREAGTAISAVLFGAIAGTGLLPITRAACEDTIRRSGLGVQASLRGFGAAYERIASMRADRASVARATPAEAARAAGRPAPPPPLADAERWPASAREIVALGHARVVEYQDPAYGRLYLERLARVAAADRAGRASPQADATPDAQTTREAARWLALWMAFDDIVRVAQLKVRAARLARVRRELGAGNDDVVRVWDHFKPGVPELAGLLPERLADALARWERRRVARGAEPFAWPLRLGVHTLAGALALRVLAGARSLRRRGRRWAVEQALIERWLDAIERGARAHPALGFELAACGRLVKGYGATNERGKATLLHVVDHLARADTDPLARAAAIRAARDAALSDASGAALDRTLAAHGAPARPPAEQPIRLVRRRAPSHVGKITSARSARSH
jgi:indolepyruvate ferredoxin oxidoreductase beta subunit